jgi:hypothetical protein
MEHVQTNSATLTWLRPNEIEVRFDPGIVLDREGIAEAIAARKRMQNGIPIGLLLIVPPDTELDAAIINTDHQRENQAIDKVLGFAVVAHNAVSEVLLRLYKAYYPMPFETEVFSSEDEARRWLGERVARSLEPSQN